MLDGGLAGVVAVAARLGVGHGRDDLEGRDDLLLGVLRVLLGELLGPGDALLDALLSEEPEVAGPGVSVERDHSTTGEGEDAPAGQLVGLGGHPGSGLEGVVRYRVEAPDDRETAGPISTDGLDDGIGARVVGPQDGGALRRPVRGQHGRDGGRVRVGVGGRDDHGDGPVVVGGEAVHLITVRQEPLGPGGAGLRGEELDLLHAQPVELGRGWGTVEQAGHPGGPGCGRSSGDVPVRIDDDRARAPGEEGRRCRDRRSSRVARGDDRALAQGELATVGRRRRTLRHRLVVRAVRGARSQRCARPSQPPEESQSPGDGSVSGRCLTARHATTVGARRRRSRHGRTRTGSPGCGLGP